MITDAFNSTYTSTSNEVEGSSSNDTIRLIIKYLATTEGIDWEDDYSCYDEKCLSSTFWKDDILDFLEDKMKASIYSFRIPVINKYECVLVMKKKSIRNMFRKVNRISYWTFLSLQDL